MAKRTQTPKPEPTPEERRAARGQEIEWVRRRIRDERDRAKEALDGFAAELAKDPVYQLGWAEAAYDNAGTYHVLSQVVAALDGGCSAKDALDTVTREALRGARSPQRSTSATSNRLEQAKTAAYAEAIERLEYLAKLEAAHAADVEPVAAEVK